MITAFTATVWAHGFGDVGDLPVTLPMLLVVSGGAVIGLAAALSARAVSGTRARRAGVRLPSLVTALADHRAARAILRLAGAILLGGIAVTAALGADDFLRNPAPALFFVFWAAVLLAGSMLVGPLWRLANPLRAVSVVLTRASGDPDEDAVRPLPHAVGVWPAAGMLAVVVWVEQAVGRQPLTVLLLLAAYALTQVGAAAVYGRAWYPHGDGFEVYSGLVGAMAPLARDDGGRLVLRSPRRRLAALDAPPGLLAVVAVLLGGHLFDSLADTLGWHQLVFGQPRLLLETAGLAASVGAVAVLAAGATHGAPFLRAALVPLVIAYGVAHYFGPLLVEAQHAVITLSDPLARGADVLGLAGRRVTYEAAPPALAAIGQITAFVGFHLVAVVMAHDRALARYDVRAARAAQFPLRGLLVVSVVGGTVLRFAPT